MNSGPPRHYRKDLSGLPHGGAFARYPPHLATTWTSAYPSSILCQLDVRTGRCVAGRHNVRRKASLIRAVDGVEDCADSMIEFREESRSIAHFEECVSWRLWWPGGRPSGACSCQIGTDIARESSSLKSHHLLLTSTLATS